MVKDPLKIKLYTLTLDCKDPYGLATFYGKLLGWEIPFYDEAYVCLGAPGAAQGAYPAILFQRNPDYEPPCWPQAPGAQQQMAHLDFAVNDLEAAVAHALSCGATEAAEQFSQDWRVMLDPAGHPFCLCQMAPLFASEAFALK